MTDNGQVLFAVAVPEPFRDVVISHAKKEGVTVEDAILKLAIAGADCLRIHGGK